MPVFLLVCAAIAPGLRLMPQGSPEAGETKPGSWDIPSRILIGTSFILLITGGASLLGSRLTGLLTTVPLYVTILAIFAHRRQGPAAAAHVLRGLLYGMFAFAGFILTLGLLLERAGTGISFASAMGVALLIQGISLWYPETARFLKRRAAVALPPWPPSPFPTSAPSPRCAPPHR